MSSNLSKNSLMSRLLLPSSPKRGGLEGGLDPDRARPLIRVSPESRRKRLGLSVKDILQGSARDSTVCSTCPLFIEVPSETDELVTEP